MYNIVATCAVVVAGSVAIAIFQGLSGVTLEGPTWARIAYIMLQMFLGAAIVNSVTRM